MIEYEPNGTVLARRNESWIKKCEGKTEKEIQVMGFVVKKSWLVPISEYNPHSFHSYKELLKA